MKDTFSVNAKCLEGKLLDGTNLLGDVWFKSAIKFKYFNIKTLKKITKTRIMLLQNSRQSEYF